MKKLERGSKETCKAKASLVLSLGGVYLHVEIQADILTEVNRLLFSSGSEAFTQFILSQWE